MTTRRTEAFLQTLTGFFHWYIGRGLNPADAIAKARAKFGNAVNLYARRAMDAARRSLENENRAVDLGPTNRLEEALGGQQPPYRTVGVRVLVEATNTRTGDTMRGSQVIDATWDMTFQEVFDLASHMLRRRFTSWRDANDMSFRVIGPFLFPHSTTL